MSGRTRSAITRLKSLAERSHTLRRIAALARAIGEYDLMALSGEMAFGLMLAIFPALLIFVTVLSLVQTPYNVKYIADLAGAILPAEIYSPLDPAITHLLEGVHERGMFTLSLLTAFWSLGTVFMTILKAQERIWELHPAAFAKRALRGLWLALISCLLLFVALNLLYYYILYQFMTVSRYDLWFLSPWILRARFPAAFLIAFVVFLVVYRFSVPGRARLREAAPGALLAALGWIALAVGFRYVVSLQTPEGSLRVAYGFVARMIAMMLWLYANSLVFLAGAAWNRVLLRTR